LFVKVSNKEAESLKYMPNISKVTWP
jgi:hypothetical protein